MRQVLIPLAVVFGAIALGFGVLWAIVVAGRPPDGVPRWSAPPVERTSQGLEIDPGWEGMLVPAFALVDQEGRAVSEDVFHGRVTILDFIFTNCPLQCPVMTGQMWEMSRDLADVPVRFISISIDPERDTPERLREYAAAQGADTRRWDFLTDEPGFEGDGAGRAMLETIGYGVRDMEEVIDLPDGSTMTNILHPTNFFLIGPDRQILGTFSYDVPEQVDQLKARAREAAGIISRRR
jgi:protein SCO1